MNGSSGGAFDHSHPSTSDSEPKILNRDEAITSTDADEFPRSLAKTAVAQICEAAGFHCIQLSALDSLADIAIRFLSDTGKASQFYANLSGRTQSNALDVLCALEDINGAVLPMAHQATTSSDTPSQLKQFVDYTQEISFCKPVPYFPILKKHTSTPSFAQVKETPPGAHIPQWLPAFPDVHTYKATPVWNERKLDPRVDKLQQAKQTKKAVQSLVSLHSRLSAAAASCSAENASDVNVKQDMKLWGMPSWGSFDTKKEGQTPIIQSSSLSSPIPVGAHGPSVPPSVIEIFAPALREATLTVQERNGAGSSRRGLFPSQRSAPGVLTFDFGRKAEEKVTLARLSLGGKEMKRGLPDLKDDEKDEKKKRAYQILKQSLTGPGMPFNEQRN